MKWVKFSERFPQPHDTSSVSIDREVIVRGVYSDTKKQYCNVVNVDDCHDWGVDVGGEWLEGAFESKINQ